MQRYEAPADVLLQLLFKLQPRDREETDLVCQAFNLGVNFTMGHKIIEPQPVLFQQPKGE